MSGTGRFSRLGAFERARRVGFVVLVVLACVGALVLWWWYAVYNMQRILTSNIDIHADFDTFYRSAQAVWNGNPSIYDTGARLTNLNPPFWTVLFLPFGLVGPLLAFRVFAGSMVALLAGAVIWTVAELRTSNLWTVLAVILLLISSPVIATLALGQLYPVLVVGLVASWIADRRGMDGVSGAALGLVVAIKPSLLPVLLWPAVRGRWGALIAALASGAFATLVGVLVLGFGSTLEYARVLLEQPINPYWDNASLPSTAARLFTPNDWAIPLALAPLMVPVAYALSLGLLILTAIRSRGDAELGLWALVAASLLVSPVAWNNYLMLLGPGILILISHRRVALAFLLLALQIVPPQWPLIWDDIDAAWASIPVSLYFFSLFLHWLALLPPARGKPEPVPAAVAFER
jgi:alpha-1,2-mannosyltransferase